MIYDSQNITSYNRKQPEDLFFMTHMPQKVYKYNQSGRTTVWFALVIFYVK